MCRRRQLPAAALVARPNESVRVTDATKEHRRIDARGPGSSGMITRTG